MTRRAAVRGCVLVVVGGAVGYAFARDSAAARRSSTTAAANGYGPSSSSNGGRRLVGVDAVPRGGGVVVAGVVVTRDEAGAVHAFSATCTHQGCTVNQIRGGVISCPCHGSRFDATTGAVVGGPAPRPLPKVAVHVSNGSVVTG